MLSEVVVRSISRNQSIIESSYHAICFHIKSTIKVAVD